MPRLLLIASLLLVGCPSAERDGFFTDRGPESTPPDEPPTPEEDARMGWVQLERSWDADGGASVAATASFHTPSSYALWPTESADLDGCSPGTEDITTWVLPSSDLDVGTPILQLTDGEVALDFDGTWWSRALANSAWEEHQAFTLRLSGGPDLPAQFFEAVVGTPGTLEFSAFDETPDGLSVAWTGANQDGEILVLISSQDAPTSWLYCRLFDDGEQVLPWDSLQGVLPDGDYVFEARRQQSADFVLGDYPGRSLGLSSATAALSIRAPSRDSSGGP